MTKCYDCGFIDASTPTTQEAGNECSNCDSENTVSTIIRGL